MSAGNAVRIARSVGEIGFPEFTAKLITDTFDALISANIRQTESYIELLTLVSKNLSTFINETKDEIDGPLILEFLQTVLPEPEGTKVAKGASLTAAEATKLNEALLVTDSTGTEIQKTTFPSGAITDARYTQILEAVAKRLSANKYDALQQMVKLGMLRLVVEKGVIESRLTFNTWGSEYSSETSSRYQSTPGRSVTPFTMLARILSRGRVAATSNLRVSTAKETHHASSGSAVQIFGMVQLSFKTDYMPLDK